MQTEGLLLDFGRFRLVVIIQTGLTDGHYPRVIQLTQQPVQGRSALGLHVQRMNPYRTVHIVIAIGQCANCSSIVGTDPYAQEMSDTPGPGGLQGSVERTCVLGEVKAVEVTMGIYKHGSNGNYIVWVGRSDLRAPAR